MKFFYKERVLMRRSIFFIFFCFGMIFAFASSAKAGSTLARIKHTGVVRCGARTTADAYAYRNKEGEWFGIDIEVCRLVASAVLGRPEAIQVVTVNYEDGFKLLEENQIDVLMAATPRNMKNEMVHGAAFPAVYYYSALAFLGHYNPDATSMKDYKGAKVCVENTPFLVKELKNFNEKYQLDMRVMAMPQLSRSKELLYLKRCDLVFARLETLHSEYFKARPANVDLVVLPEIVKTYPTGPFIRDDDKEMFKIMRWLIFGVINAEKKGISSQNIEDFLNTDDPEIMPILREDSQIADKLGIDVKWLYRALAEQGNYGEIYERGLGEKSILKLKRSANQLVKNGGLIDAPSFQE